MLVLLLLLLLVANATASAAGAATAAAAAAAAASTQIASAVLNSARELAPLSHFVDTRITKRILNASAVFNYEKDLPPSRTLRTQELQNASVVYAAE